MLKGEIIIYFIVIKITLAKKNDRKINMINDAIARFGNDLTLLREKQSAEISFKAKASV